MDYLLGRYFFSSLILHIGLLAFLFIGHPGFPDGADGFKGVENAKVKEKDTTVEIEFDGDKDFNVPKKKQATETTCEHWYGGIGITNKGLVVMDVFKGYPADQAGIVSGDLIVDLSEPEILGEPGTKLRLTIQSVDGRLREVIVTRGKICYDDM